MNVNAKNYYPSNSFQKEPSYQGQWSQNSDRSFNKENNQMNSQYPKAKEIEGSKEQVKKKKRNYPKQDQENYNPNRNFKGKPKPYSSK